MPKRYAREFRPAVCERLVALLGRGDAEKGMSENFVGESWRGHPLFARPYRRRRRPWSGWVG